MHDIIPSLDAIETTEPPVLPSNTAETGVPPVAVNAIVTPQRDETLGDALRDYIAAIAEFEVIAIDLRVDRGTAAAQIEEFWPKDAEGRLPEQGSILLKRIEAVIQAIPIVSTTPMVIVRIAGANEPLTPHSLPEPHQAASLATFDSVAGIMHHCLVAPTEEGLPALDMLTVPSGIMVIAQPIPEFMNRYSDHRGQGMGAGGDLFRDRIKDQHLPQHKVETQPSAPPPALEPK